MKRVEEEILLRLHGTGAVSKTFLSILGQLKDTLKGFDDLKNKQKNVWSNVFWYVKLCVFWQFIQYISSKNKPLVYS